MAERKLGLTRLDAPAAEDQDLFPVSTNTRVSLWPERYPAIALQECIDLVEAAPKDKQSEVKFNLPCQTCPENTGCLNAKAKEVGPLIYAREILTSPMSNESSLFPRKIFRPMLQAGESLVPFWNAPFSLEHEYKIVQAWDIAWSEKVGGDYLVCMTGYIHLPTGLRQLLYVERWQRLGFKQQCELIETKWRQYKADLVVIEGDAAQAIWSQHMSAETPVPVLRHDAAGDKHDLAVGVPGLLIAFANRKWRIPWTAGTYLHDEVENMLKEFAAFGWVDGKLQGVGEHDDAVMAFWHLHWGMDRMVYFSSDTNTGHSGHVEGKRG